MAKRVSLLIYIPNTRAIKVSSTIQFIKQGFVSYHLPT